MREIALTTISDQSDGDAVGQIGDDVENEQALRGAQPDFLIVIPQRRGSTTPPASHPFGTAPASEGNWNCTDLREHHVLLDIAQHGVESQ
jgi:hypothetical protein